VSEPQRGEHWYRRGIRTLQFLSIGAARAQGDAITLSVGISLVAVQVYALVASVLTYVFFGLQRGRRGAEE